MFISLSPLLKRGMLTSFVCSVIITSIALSYVMFKDRVVKFYLKCYEMIPILKLLDTIPDVYFNLSKTSPRLKVAVDMTIVTMLRSLSILLAPLSLATWGYLTLLVSLVTLTSWFIIEKIISWKFKTFKMSLWKFFFISLIQCVVIVSATASSFLLFPLEKYSYLSSNECVGALLISWIMATIYTLMTADFTKRTSESIELEHAQLWSLLTSLCAIGMLAVKNVENTGGPVDSPEDPSPDVPGPEPSPTDSTSSPTTDSSPPSEPSPTLEPPSLEQPTLEPPSPGPDTQDPSVGSSKDENPKK